MILKKYFMKSVNRITKDFKQRELLPLKLVFFVQASTISVLYPYLTIHMRELGINVEEAAIMSAVIPVIGIIMPPMAGMVADKIGNFKLLLVFFSLIGGAASLLLLLVPVGRVTVTFPTSVTLDFGCSGPENDPKRYFQLGFSSDFPCEQSPGLNGSDTKDFSFDTKLEACGFICSSGNQSVGIDQDVVLKGRSYSIEIKFNGSTSIYHYNLQKGDVPKAKTKEDALSHRIMVNDHSLQVSIRRLTPSQYFLPATDVSKLSCVNASREGYTNDQFICSIEEPGEEIGDIVPTVNTTLRFILKKLKEGNELNQYQSDFAEFSSANMSHLHVSCKEAKPKEKNISAFVYLHNPENNLEILDTLPLTNCEPRCLVSAERKNLCTNSKEEVLYDPELTFWVYLVIRVFIGIIGSTSYAMYEVAVIAILREQKADYGLQRIYAYIGGMISSPLSGMLIDYASQGKGYTDFRPAFYLYAGLKTGTSILLLFINLEFKKAASNVISDAIEVLKNLEIIALLVACFVLGTAWGYIESFLFWFLEDLGGTRSLMGITITVGGIAGIPLLVLSGPIIDKIGHANVLFIGFVFYAIRLVGYSVIYNPYHCLFFEAMESITSSLAITAVVTYAAKLSTTTTDGSVQGLVGGLYFGVGRGAGSLIGGYLMKAFGTRPTYRIFAVFSLVTGFAYYLFNLLYIRKQPQTEGNEICKKEPKPNKNLNAEVQVITDKPKTGSKEYGAIQIDNNNSTNVKEADEVNQNKEEEKDKNENEKGSHDNPGYVPENEENLKEEEETKKKED